MNNWLLIVALGFFGSFGHCIGMCGPLTVAFSLSQKSSSKNDFWRQIAFNSTLNLGRIFSYTIVGAVIGTTSSVLVAGGQLAGIGSSLRQWLTVVTGILLIIMGLRQINPRILKKIPLINPPWANWRIHNLIHSAMLSMSKSDNCLMPLFLGMSWGLIPCGFLYAAQIKASESGNFYSGALTMLGFGLGTLPSMLGVGITTSKMSKNRRSQLFKLSGWVMILMGILSLTRTGNTMTNTNGHLSLFCLMLALTARPISKVWNFLLQYRRLFGVSAFIFAVIHTIHISEHTFNWNPSLILFMLPEHQKAIWAGGDSLLLMLPAACTSFDTVAKKLGLWWRHIHLLTVGALVLAVWHSIILGNHYLGTVVKKENLLATMFLICMASLVLLIRFRWFWKLFLLEKYYAPVIKSSENFN